MILASIDLRSIDQSKCVNHKNGKKYCELVLIDTPNGKYGDYMVVQGISKEEREAGKKGVILGNGKTVGKGAQKRATNDPRGQDEGFNQERDDSIPF